MDRYKFHINGITLKNGTQFLPSILTVIVGPNNSGKSRFIKDLSTKLTHPTQFGQVKIIESCTINMPTTLNELRDSYEVERYKGDHDQWTSRAINPSLKNETIINHGSGKSFVPPFAEFEIFNDMWNPDQIVQSFGWQLHAYLGTDTRLSLVNDSDSPNDQHQKNNLLQILYSAGRKPEAAIREIVKKVFNKDIILDYSSLKRLKYRVGNDLSIIPSDPREAKFFLEKEEILDDQGDGIRSFVGIITALLILKRDLFFIDEPEAFLHPPQAFKMGEFIAEQTKNGKQVFLATHSADVLRGILGKSADVTIIRIDRKGDTNFINKLSIEEIKTIINDPLLSSARVFEGMFYQGAVVVEAESDLRFYQAVSNKIYAEQDIHFVNANNKQTVPKIISHYKKMGISCVGIVDFDVLNDQKEFEKQLISIGVSHEDCLELLAIRNRIAQEAARVSTPSQLFNSVRGKLTEIVGQLNGSESLIGVTSESNRQEHQLKLLNKLNKQLFEIADSTKGWNELKKNGKKALPNSLEKEFERLWNKCASYGLFINPAGELESMLQEYGIDYTNDKRGWITKALQLLPGLEVNIEKMPWMFIKKIHKQLTRHNLPS